MKRNEATVDGGMDNLAEEARALLGATADVAGEKVEQARKRLAVALDQGSRVYGHWRDEALERAKAADKAVHEHPYAAVGVGFAVGALVGFLLTRRNGA